VLAIVMANAAAKRIGMCTMSVFSTKLSLLFFSLANQNESTVKTLKLGVFMPTLVSFVLRFLFRRSSLPPSKGSLAIYIVAFFPAFFLSNYLIKIGTTRRDPITGTLISYGEDLSQPGVTEWCFDILYITCMSLRRSSDMLISNILSGACQIGSGAFGDWFWWLYMVVSDILDSRLYDYI
jgi:hypothetical protein